MSQAPLRFTWLLVVCSFGCGGSVDRDRFEELYRAGKSVEVAVTEGVNLIGYRELLQRFATEIRIAQDRASNTGERDMTVAYDYALTAYRDAETIWTARGNSGDELTSVDAVIRRIAGDYPIDGTGTGSNFAFNSKDAVQVIWKFADRRLARADALYNGGSARSIPPVP